MLLRRVLIPVVMLATLLLQFLPGTALGPQPVAATACNAAQFIADVTISDGSVLAPGGTYLKTWQLKNVGSCNWTSSYAAVFSSGDQMGAPAVVYLPATNVGATVNISINITAPTTNGHYRGNWKLRNASGGRFGVGASANAIFWVDIFVNSSSTSGTTYDFVDHCSEALWASGPGAVGLACPGVDNGNANGFVMGVNAPQLETGSNASTHGLMVDPKHVAGGWIKGFYPAYTVHSGDHFQSIINCAYSAHGCYDNFQLMYQIGGSGSVNTLWSFNERWDGLYYPVNIDLSSLVGQSVNFILYVADVNGHGTPGDDKAVWVGPRITGPGGGSVPPITPSSTCNKGAFVQDWTIPDGTVMAPGTHFTKTWQIRNVGSCAWTTSYALVHIMGYDISSPNLVYLPSSIAPVNPGDTNLFSVDMVAPSTPGHYRSYWRFQDGSGHQFGVGSGMITFFADIFVSGSAPTSTPIATATTGPAPTATSTPNPTPTAILSGPNADLGITVTDGVLSYTPGTALTYKIKVTNYGPYTVTNALVNVTRTSNVASWTVSCVATGTGASCMPGTSSPAGDIGDTVSIPVSGNVEYTVVTNPIASAFGNIVVTATIANPLATPDPNLANNSATDTDQPPSADLAVTIDDGISVYTAGGVVTYTINIINYGPLAVTGATFHDPKPTLVDSWIWTCSPLGGASWSGPTSSTADYAATVNLPIGSRVTCVVNASINVAATGDLVNTVSITNPLGTPDPNTTNNTASHTDSGPSADLSVTMDDGVDMYSPGDILTYTIVVRNNGPQAAHATFTDNQPPEVMSWTWSCATDIESTCTVPGGPIGNFTDTTVYIPSGHFITYKAVTTIYGAPPLSNPYANLVNTATIASNFPTPPITDPNTLNNTVTHTDAPPNADLAVTMVDGQSSYQQNQTVHYTITVSNNGPKDTTAALFHDAIPANILSWTWTCVPSDGSVTCASHASFSADLNDTVTIPAHKYLTYTVAAIVKGTALGDLENIASITIVDWMDLHPLNNQVSDVDTFAP